MKAFDVNLFTRSERNNGIIETTFLQRELFVFCISHMVHYIFLMNHSSKSKSCFKIYIWIRSWETVLSVMCFSSLSIFFSSCFLSLNVSWEFSGALYFGSSNEDYRTLLSWTKASVAVCFVKLDKIPKTLKHFLWKRKETWMNRVCCFKSLALLLTDAVNAVTVDHSWWWQWWWWTPSWILSSPPPGLFPVSLMLHPQKAVKRWNSKEKSIWDWLLT